MHSYDSVESLIDGERESNIHVECSRPVTMRALVTVRGLYKNRRCAFYLRSDRGFDRDSVRSYLRFFGALSGTRADAETAIDHFGLRPVASKRIGKLDDEQRAMVNFARMSLADPEICFIEYPLGYLGSAARSLTLRWIAEASERGTLFITTGQPLRDALLMPGMAWWMDQPAKQLIVDLFLPGDQDVVGPPVGIGLHRHSDPLMLHPVGQPEGDQQAVLGPVLLPPDRQGGGRKQVAAIEADLALLNLD